MKRDRIGRKIPKRPCKRKECLAQKARIVDLDGLLKHMARRNRSLFGRIAELEKQQAVVAGLFECKHCALTVETFAEILDPELHGGCLPKENEG